MHRRTRLRLAATLLCCSAAAATADERGDAAKHGFNLFNPTPRELLRPLTTDRPDATESPITVDAGRVQIESSLLEYARASRGGHRVQSVAVLPTNIKFGLLDNADIQFVFTPLQRTRTDTTGSRERAQGFGDEAQIRLKVNLWGNDGLDARFGATAFAVMPFVKFPSGPRSLRGNRVEGGVILPLAISMPGEFSLGLMAEFDLVYDDDRRQYGVDFVHTATIGHPIVGHLSGYLEYVGIAPRVGRYQPMASGGLTYSLSVDSSVDVGTRMLISRSARDVTVFAGVSRRF